jgi:hypothetical protein
VQRGGRRAVTGERCAAQLCDARRNFPFSFVVEVVYVVIRKVHFSPYGSMACV